MTDDDLQEMYKLVHADSHLAALKAIYQAGVDQGIAQSTPIPPSPTPSRVLAGAAVPGARGG